VPLLVTCFGALNVKDTLRRGLGNGVSNRSEEKRSSMTQILGLKKTTGGDMQAEREKQFCSLRRGEGQTNPPLRTKIEKFKE